MGQKRNVYKVLMGRPDEKVQLGKLVNNTKMDFRQVGWDGMYWIDTAQDRGL
jgi:hypothetical protein